MSDFDIDATGATFVFQDNSARGMQFVNCLNVSFHGATMYFATPPFSQGVVQAIASDLTSIDVQIEKGYPTNLDDTRYFSAQSSATCSTGLHAGGSAVYMATYTGKPHSGWGRIPFLYPPARSVARRSAI